jgi:hypothetical protein
MMTLGKVLLFLQPTPCWLWLRSMHIISQDQLWLCFWDLCSLKKKKKKKKEQSCFLPSREWVQFVSTSRKIVPCRWSANLPRECKKNVQASKVRLCHQLSRYHQLTVWPPSLSLSFLPGNMIELDHYFLSCAWRIPWFFMLQFLPWTEVFIENYFCTKRPGSPSSSPPRMEWPKAHLQSNLSHYTSHCIGKGREFNISILAKGKRSGDRPPGLESWLHHLLLCDLGLVT